MSARAQAMYAPTALINGEEPTAEALEKAKNTPQIFFKKKTAQDRLWRRLRKRYDDQQNRADGDYGDDEDVEGFEGIDTAATNTQRSKYDIEGNYSQSYFVYFLFIL